jgi:predicted nucleotidyltransferase
MRYHDPLDLVLGQLSKVRILRFLVNREGEQGGREIARNIGLSHPIVHRSLRELATHGLILSRWAGGTLLYRTNPDHWLAKGLLRPLFTKERDTLGALGAFLLERLHTPDASVILFGSVGRGEERPDSDLDLLVILPSRHRRTAIEAKLFEVAPEVTRVFGNRLAPVVLTRAEFRERFRRHERWVRGVLKEGQLIAGPPLTELVSRHGP